jgi:hypothetical protein
MIPYKRKYQVATSPWTFLNINANRRKRRGEERRSKGIHGP